MNIVLRTRILWGLLGVAAIAALAVIIVDGGSETGSPPGTATDTAAQEQTDRTESRPGAPSAPPRLRTPDEKAGAEVVATAYDGLLQATKAKVVPLRMEVRSALRNAADDEGLGQMCEAMSRGSRSETIAYARMVARLGDEMEWNCEMAVAMLVHSAKVGGHLERAVETRVVTVNVDGDRATATLDYGKGTPRTSVSLVKEDGDWKIGAPQANGGDG